MVYYKETIISRFKSVLEGFSRQICSSGLRESSTQQLKNHLTFWIQANGFSKEHVLRINLSFAAKLPVETTDETDEKAANLKWAQQTGADYYVVKINGTDIHPDVLIGKQTFLEVHYHTLVLKNNKQDAPETTVCVEVSAFDSTGVIARTTDPSCKTMGKL